MTSKSMSLLILAITSAMIALVLAVTIGQWRERQAHHTANGCDLNCQAALEAEKNHMIQLCIDEPQRWQCKYVLSDFGPREALPEVPSQEQRQ